MPGCHAGFYVNVTSAMTPQPAMAAAALSGTWRLAVADVDGNNNGSLTSWAIQFRFASANIFSSVKSFAIPDYSTAGVSSAISVTLCSRPPSVQLRRISVIFNITHTCDQDLVINLASPDKIVAAKPCCQQ